jgi:hypothetical protein
MLLQDTFQRVFRSFGTGLKYLKLLTINDLMIQNDKVAEIRKN